MIVSNYNINPPRQARRAPMIPHAELEELAHLETICFPPEELYDLDTLAHFASRNGAGLLRWIEPRDNALPHLAAFHLFNCFTAELITLDVHPDHRRRGIGTALVTESLRKLRELGHRQATCQIATSNENSLQLHYRLGFKPVRTLRNYYGARRDAHLLVATLQGP
ncbi:hypothetical protein CVU37_02320 [candidate division BRC1 bacterium HGW-BRC1-1]|jgi:ribosomal protein S18 acetylase RimI-like enzyme|nr:MAG: hypothetical protein CVU37_02320 [candidate division BRC1 bacterium HGW-BRC1-1]